MAFGLNWYLKYYAQASVSLNGSQVRLPQPAAAVAKKFRE